MVIWMLVVGVSLLLSVLVIRLVWRSGYNAEIDPQQIVGQCAAALCAFRLLVDQKEEVYLRASLPEPKFRTLQRNRLRLAMRCLTLLDRNTTLLAATGQRAALSGDPDLAKRGERLAISSFQLKVSLLAAEGAVLVKWLFPGSRLRVHMASLAGQEGVPSLPGL